jgi:hypothetical protein
MAKIDWQDADGTVAGEPEYRGKNTYSVVFTYKVDGHFYSGTFTTGDSYKDGDSLPVRYDPKNPDYSDLTQKESRQRWLIVGIFVVVGLLVLWARLN